MINYDADRGVSVSNEASGSFLILKGATASDSGNYTCSPYNIRPASVTVHVAPGNDAQAAVISDGNEKAPPPSAAVQSDGGGALKAVPVAVLAVAALIRHVL